MAGMPKKNYYEILEVSETASTEEIRKSFQKKARTLHPDVNKEPDAEERFKEVSEAYAVLSDSEKRAHYDAMLRGMPVPGSGPHSPFGGQSPDFGFGGFGGNWSVFSRQPAYKPTPGQDVRIELSLTREEAKEGCKKGVSFDRYVTCEVCHGTGSRDGNAPITCNMCGGKGTMEIDLSQLMGIGLGTMQMPCPQCEGSGKIVSDPCERCGGAGRHMGAGETVVTILPKSHDEEVIYKDNLGNAGTNGAPSGNLQVHISIPQERLSHESRIGFQVIGFGLPFIFFGLFQNELVFSLIAIIAAFLIGACIIIKNGCLHKSAEWWRNGGKALLSGATNGVVFVIFLLVIVSCTANTYHSFDPSGRGF